MSRKVSGILPCAAFDQSLNLSCTRVVSLDLWTCASAIDSPEMDHARPVVTVSFGAAREIWMRCTDQAALARAVGRRYVPGVKTTAEVFRQVLAPGSALVMLPGMQRTWQHRIPKHDRPCGPRISLTFRGYVRGD